MNIYVSNLDQKVTEEDLRKLFSQFGEVSSAKVITDFDTGSSRGFAFIEMPRDTDGHKAINKLNNTGLNERSISVQVAKPKQPRSSGSN